MFSGKLNKGENDNLQINSQIKPLSYQYSLAMYTNIYVQQVNLI